ncbi:hypothetical protein Tsubulata_030073 [Turnera subulata]|uniref:Peptidase C1A papain C-terminal domain-containing protein n=1 Tax=Turnera subulata TaxID=218843 RepID=A0A9Q0J9W1_9ROSI|nr:hypothetical protein Tsubulata_030073 [Turnera subulata]
MRFSSGNGLSVGCPGHVDAFLSQGPQSIRDITIKVEKDGTPICQGFYPQLVHHVSLILSNQMIPVCLGKAAAVSCLKEARKWDCPQLGRIAGLGTSRENDDEMVSTHGAKGKQGKGKGSVIKKAGDLSELLPCSVDWIPVLPRDIVHQGKYLICWAITVALVVGAFHNISNPEQPHVILSPQQLINCAMEELRSRRTGEVRDCPKKLGVIYEYVIERGLCKEEECRFIGRKDLCKDKKYSSNPIKIEDYIEEFNVDEKVLLELVAKNPVVAEMDDTKEFASLKKGEIYGLPKAKVSKSTCKSASSKRKAQAKAKASSAEVGSSKKFTHDVLIVGYGTVYSDDGEEDIHYWVVRNSLGTGWGDNGYGKVLRQISMKHGSKSLFLSYSCPKKME